MKFKNIIFLLLGLAVLVYLLAKMDINFSDVIHSVKLPGYVILAALIVTAIPLINALRMRFIIFPMGKKMLPLHDLFTIEYIYKFLSNVMPFKLNVPAKAVLLNRMCGVRLSNGASVVSFEYALDSAIVIVFGFLGAFAYFRNDTRISFASIEYFISITFLCSIAFFSIPSDYFGKLLSKADRIPVKAVRLVITSGFKLLWSIRGTWATLILHREMIKVLALTAIVWGSSILINEFLFLSIGRYVPPTWILVAICSGIFIGGISTIPGGLGVREATMVLVYSYLGIPNDASVAVVLLGRVLSALPVVTGYLYSLKIGYDKIMQYKMDTNL
jgi:uncharacterized protein (TIRG00374 family)